jgi:hypothetical protein
MILERGGACPPCRHLQLFALVCTNHVRADAKRPVRTRFDHPGTPRLGIGKTLHRPMRTGVGRSSSSPWETRPPDQIGSYRRTMGRVLIDHTIMGGVPCIQGTRIPGRYDPRIIGRRRHRRRDTGHVHATCQRRHLGMPPLRGGCREPAHPSATGGVTPPPTVHSWKRAATATAGLHRCNQSSIQVRHGPPGGVGQRDPIICRDNA